MEEYGLLLASVLSATLRTSTTLVFCAMAGLFSERSGIIDIGLEGKMLAAAFMAASLAAFTGSAIFGLAGALGVAVAFSLLHGLTSITYRGNQVVSGVAINIIAAGLTVVLGNAWFGRGGITPALPPQARFMPIAMKIDALAAVPIIGPLFSSVIGHNGLVYTAFLLVPCLWWLLYRTRFGLRLRATGEDPKVIDSAGISVTSLRYAALTLNGLLCGLAGTYLAMAQNASFSPNMTAGRGFMALAAMIFGKWRPIRTLGACLLFGLLDAIAIRLQGVALPAFGEIPVQAIQALPYLLTVILLAGFIGKAVAPGAIGQPYSKER